MRPLSVESPLPDTRAGAAAEAYDFGRRTTLAREHSRVLELAFDTFARQWGMQLSARLRASCAVVAEEVRLASYDEYAAALPATTVMVLCALEGLDAKAVLQFPSEAALTWVSRMLGGGAGTGAPDRKFTQIEQSLVRNLMDDAVEDLGYSFGSLLPSRPAVDAIAFNSQFAQAAATDALMVVAAFSVRVGDGNWRATAALPAAALLPQLGSGSPTSDPADAAAALRAQVAQVPVDVALALPPVPVTPVAILNLAVGDVVSLRHATSRPLDLTLGGKPVARAVGVTHGSRRAGQIVTIEETAP
ncbi:flagellar motor switch protein FliM [Specibacter cremeus]|uniref:flagellar motor switch protein FliM n=1 Tax=Specibacter cremeus TaxID=1629051 RepID=UPI000F7B6EDF|nr:flagellar motor switch protein FliM [Specibacter cremeus]